MFKKFYYQLLINNIIYYFITNWAKHVRELVIPLKNEIIWVKKSALI